MLAPSRKTRISQSPMDPEWNVKERREQMITYDFSVLCGVTAALASDPANSGSFPFCNGEKGKKKNRKGHPSDKRKMTRMSRVGSDRVIRSLEGNGKKKRREF